MHIPAVKKYESPRHITRWLFGIFGGLGSSIVPCMTTLMQACQYGHWEVVMTLVLFKANIHRADYLNGGTTLHFATLNGHSRCIRILLVDYIPNIPNFCNILSKKSRNEESILDFDRSALDQVINGSADGGITALHMAALNGHVESVHLLLELGYSWTVSKIYTISRRNVKKKTPP